VRHINGQPVVSRNFNRLFNGHRESIAQNTTGSK
jgi:hypothetical protein